MTLGATIFRSIYFPPERTGEGVARRLSISLPDTQPDSVPSSVFEAIRMMSSAHLRIALGDPTLESLLAAAHAQNRSVSNYCFSMLTTRVSVNKGSFVAESNSSQYSFPLLAAGADESQRLGVTFQESKRLPYHRWYPYVEGFSAAYARGVLQRFGSVQSIYDPFGGAGTAQLEASALGLESYYSEINPFMRFVAEAKINASIWARANLSKFDSLCDQFSERLRSKDYRRRASSVSLAGYEAAFPTRSFFEETHLRDLLAARDLAREVGQGCPEGQSLLLLAVVANTVRSSHMTRRADLRRRRQDEYKNRKVDVRRFVEEKLSEIATDLRASRGPITPMRHVSDDARSCAQATAARFDLAITSPPYLNGTNYFRNTKLELWLLGFLEREEDLRLYTNAAVAAGINNVSRERLRPNRFDQVERIVEALQATDGDKRIPLLVRYYFSDMFDLLKAVYAVLRPEGRFVMDIGDSKFYGIHVPTDRLLCTVANEAGFAIEGAQHLARRLSYDKTELRQVELVFHKPKGRTLEGNGRLTRGLNHALPLPVPAAFRETHASDVGEAISSFKAQLPHRSAPYLQRNWGDPLHSLCSYQGKLKPAIAHWLVKLFSAPGMVVLDPLGGVGTVAFEACLQGRYGLTNDLSPLAYCVATGKVARPDEKDVEAALSRLERAIETEEPTVDDRAGVLFGLNGSVRDFYHVDTLEEILKARRFFLELKEPTPGDLFLKACLLHVLHGNRPYALSRNSHPITPFHPTGPRVYKSVTSHVARRAESALHSQLPHTFARGASFHGDFRELPARVTQVDRIITSPPFWGMRFDRPNWLRMWFCGWNEGDFRTVSRRFLERQQAESLGVYSEFYDVCRTLLRHDGLMIMHLGGSNKHHMLEALVALADNTFKVMDIISEDVTGLERHGIKDKGLTTTHNYIFLAPKNYSSSGRSAKRARSSR